MRNVQPKLRSSGVPKRRSTQTHRDVRAAASTPGPTLHPPKGLKLDGDKLRYDLVDVYAHEAMVDVLTFGVRKYAANNWQHVPNARERYYAALLRHLTEWRMGELTDEDSGGRLHLAHAACCLHFLLAFDTNPHLSEVLSPPEK